MKYVIAYDISDDKARRRVHKTLKNNGYWKQNSVFELDLSQEELKELKFKLTDIINIQEDNLKFYPICSSCDSKIIEVGKRKDNISDKKLLII